MGRSYPIWNKIQSCAYGNKPGSRTGNKSYGIKEHGEVEIVIGTSSSNSHSFVTTKTTHRKHENGTREYRFYVDGILIRQATLAKGSTEPIFYDWLLTNEEVNYKNEWLNFNTLLSPL